MTPHPGTVYQTIRESYLRYYDTAFGLKDPGIMAERRALLEAPGAIFAEPLLEPVLPYEPGDELWELASRNGLTRHEADLLAQMLFPAGPGAPQSDGSFRVYQHQAKAFEAALAETPPWNTIVTAGTGSGKTESFLLPLFARLLRESRSWPSAAPVYRWWDPANEGRPWQPMRAGTDRAPAIRAMILYPTNALVEDQVTRLRRAIRNCKVSGGPRLYFGRYTGQTLGVGHLPTKGAAVREVAAELLSAERDMDGLPPGDLDLRAQFPDPREGEMFTRWDMIKAPPDIMVTNYSMLNVILLRGREQPMFEATAQWLRSDPSHVFTLVVDELHTYRGTEGTEVALVVRNLLRRLGLEPGSPQLRCVGTSASLTPGAAGSLEYLEGFFGVDRANFAIIPGAPRRGVASKVLSRAKYQALAALPPDQERDAALREARREDDLAINIASACMSDGATRATRLSVVSERAFGCPPIEGDSAMDAVLQALAGAEASEEVIPLRAHLFARNVRGMWACANPGCDRVPAEWRSPGRAIGRLFLNPANTCSCGGRVLELLYCDQCGEISLGGYVVDASADDCWYLGAGEAELPGSSSPLVNHRRYGSYMWFAPGLTDPPPDNADGAWTHKGPAGTTVFRFARGDFDHSLGVLQPAPGGPANCIMLRVTNAPPEPAAVPALPERCPHCELGKHNNHRLNAFFRGVVSSPIRGHRTGFARIGQVAVSSLLRATGTTPGSGKTIVFTDSRDDAARTGAGLELNGFRETIRQLLYDQVQSEVSPAALFADAAAGRPMDAAATELLEAYKKEYPDAWAAFKMAAAGIPEEVDKARAFTEAHGRLGIDWPGLVAGVERHLVHLGTNPAGPGASLQHFQRDYPWRELYSPPGEIKWQTAP
ncbi:MAG: DEAD/DEAH box helicase, partial [Dehalococcoidia bacterium]